MSIHERRIKLKKNKTQEVQPLIDQAEPRSKLREDQNPLTKYAENEVQKSIDLPMDFCG